MPPLPASDVVSVDTRQPLGEPSAQWGRFIGAQWRAFCDSYDPREFVATGGVVSGLVVLGALLSSLGALGYYPPLAQASGFRDPHVPLALALAGGMLSGLAYRFEQHRTLGPLFTLLDNGFYSAALALAAISTQGGYAVGLAVTHALAATAIPAAIYSLSALLALVVWLPPLFLVVWFVPPLEVAVILLAGVVPFILVSYQTGCRRRFDRDRQVQADQQRHERTEREEPLQLALTRAVLDMGHLLHELRNKQAAVEGSLHVLARHAQADGPAQAALEVAMEAERDQLQFVERVLGQVKRDAESEARPFRVVPVLESVAREFRGLAVSVPASADDCRALGDPERLKWVLANLIRNAEQAKAQRVTLCARMQEGRVQIDVVDDGPGFEPTRWARLFEPFVASNRAGSTGLGLYLCRRYVEVAGGQLEGLSTGPGGTTFRVHLRVAEPARAADAPAANRDIA
jgi:signal transduction histidine kinase